MNKLGSETSHYYYMQDMPHQILEPSEQGLLAHLYLTMPHPDAGAGTAWNSWAHHGHRLWAAMPEEFWLYTYKMRLCSHAQSHDWMACPFAHKGEHARRRDLLHFPYVAISCPYFRRSAAGGNNGYCPHGLNCGYAHGVFELWLHPAKFRTSMCFFGLHCTRRICFFAHCTAELRQASAMGEVPCCSVPPRWRGSATMDAMAGLGTCTMTATTGSGSPWDRKEEEMVLNYPHIELIMDLLGN